MLFRSPNPKPQTPNPKPLLLVRLEVNYFNHRMDAKSREQSHKDTLAHAKEIKWGDLNYPPCLKVIHYDPTELSGRVKLLSERCRSAWLLTIFFYLLNTASNSIQLWKLDVKPRRVLEGLLHMLIVIPITLMLFYRGYRSVAFDNTMLKSYLLQELPLILFFCFCLKYDVLCYNGFDRFLAVKDVSGWDIQSYIILAEEFFLLVMIIVRIRCMCFAISWRSRDAY